jgi:hypothetical protein
MEDKTSSKLLRAGRLTGVCLVVLLLISGCGPNLQEHSQACQASNDAKSPECANYWGKARQNQATALSAKDIPPSTQQGQGYAPPIQDQGYPSPGVQSRRQRGS